MLPASGRQHTLTGYGYEAVIASVGATLRVLTCDGRHLVVPFDADQVRPDYRGATLAPWPNRVVDGRYSFAGARHQLALTEPSRGHALHGLAAWLEFDARIIETDRVVLSVVIEPQLGYPFRVQVDVEYRLAPDGLTQVVTGRNVGADSAPWGAGPHPYLIADRSSPGAVDSWTLSLSASEVLTVTDDRLSPLAVEPVDRHPQWDFRTPRAIGETFIDHAFTGLSRAAGLTSVEVRSPEGGGTAITWDEACPWVQIHTADTPERPRSHRIGLAVEPMTCPPDAFNSGSDLVIIDPGEAHAASWTIRAL